MAWPRPTAWHLEYWSDADKKWTPISAQYPTATLNTFNEVAFETVTTRCLRAVFDASTDGKTYAAVAAQEWEALYPKPVLVEAADTKLSASATCVPSE
ncbi:hypothetical protein OVA03_15750 [Asticcacaulis sp. SL142]|uniref:hypothetical protein n=1 Tax=Asticcacaulis sp. SL142 TaxID=2995155 RepID=UPI00226C9309|nr:hypothetical protein [Asticcacaulis sp. SL142]WAC48129.1 hypothetical protein OVA03_15750 [Asticcacaulis sp. SL142]